MLNCFLVWYSKHLFITDVCVVCFGLYRFLKPSQVPGIDTEAFMRQQQIASNLHEQSILGYRGLTGNANVFF